jgi:hypothetical protein
MTTTMAIVIREETQIVLDTREGINPDGVTAPIMHEGNIMTATGAQGGETHPR